MMTGFVVLKMVLIPSRHFLASLANSGPRWSMIGVSIARSTRSGSTVGPGICRKWRPTGGEEVFDISKSFPARDFSGGEPRRPGPAATGRHEGRMRDSVKPLGAAFLERVTLAQWSLFRALK